MKQYEIMGFRGHYDFLSNFHAAPVNWQGLQFPTSENAYQWAKAYFFGANTDETIEAFQRYTPAQAKKEGQKFNIDKAVWNKQKFRFMLSIVQAKFDQNPDLAKMLMDTSDAEIYELNNWGDVYWGIVERDGEYFGNNHLGEILMLVRSSLRGWGLSGL